MKTKDRDPASYFAITGSFLKQAELEETEYKVLTNELKRYLSRKLESKNYIHPIITKFCTDFYREFYRLINFKDPYKKLKDLSNQEAKKILQTLNIESFQDAVKVSVQANKLDFGAVLILNPDLNKMQEEFINYKDTEFTLNDSKELEEQIKKAKNILFLPDNAGEIIFDIPLLKEINKYLSKDKIKIAGKESPMLNDVTFSELKELGLEEYGTLISTGSNCFGLHEEDVSSEFKKTLKEADLIIAKGQAYLEFFTEYNFENVFHITRVKYPIINSTLGILNPHQNIVISSKRYAENEKKYDFGTAHPKIIERSKIKEVGEKLRKEGKKIVTTNGSFDIVHLGHIKTLEDAKNQGDVLIVGLNSDISIKQYKSKYRPINPQERRAEFLAALTCVDYITIFDETDPRSLLEEIKPNVHCNGAEYGENCIESETIKKYGGKIHIMPKIEGLSTTEMIKQILEIQELEKKSTLKNEEKKEKILKTIEKQKGILFALPAIVYRESYSGRDILAKNSKFEKEYTDQRGYLPVEWWIMSTTLAENEIKKENEGLTQLKIENEMLFLKDIINECKEEIMGTYESTWPLTKILDIGGDPVEVSYSKEKEVPPIPLHVHSGNAVKGKIQPPGKKEAYFFPPVNIPPYNQDFGHVITRLGLKPETKKEEFLEALTKFGKEDIAYSFANMYEIKPYDGWTIPSKIVHAPGPWITFEIQAPQDDFNLLGWQLGKRLENQDLKKSRKEVLLKGLDNEHELLEQTIDWENSTDPNFKNKHYRPSKIREQGKWGRRIQIFFDDFYGEGFEIQPEETFTRNPDQRPFAGIVWSGKGTINGNILNVDNEESKEFLVTPNTKVEIKNKSNTPLIIYTVFPIKKEQ